MTVDSANAHELGEIAREVGADVLEGVLRYPSETGGWRLGNLDLNEYLDLYRGKRLVLIIAPVGEAEPETYTCGICGFVMNEVRECPRCKLQAEEFERDVQEQLAEQTSDVFEQVRELLNGGNNQELVGVAQSGRWNVDQLQKIASIIESLMDELSRGWINYCAAKHLHEAFASRRLTGARWLCLACYQGCMESSALALSRMLIKHSDSIHIGYLLNYVEQSSGAFAHASRATVLGSVAAHRLELEEAEPLLSHLKDERDWIIAHLDRRLITQPDVILSRSGVNMEKVGQAYRLVLRIVNTYAGYLGGPELRLDNVEREIGGDLEYLIGLMERGQGRSRKT